MIDKQNIQGKEADKNEQDGNLKSEEMGKISNAFLGQMGYEQEGKTESFQGNWTGDYGSGFVGGAHEGTSSGDFVSQASNTGNGLTSDEDDLLASGQKVDDLGLGENDLSTSGGKMGENDNLTQAERNKIATKASQESDDPDNQADMMPDPEDTTSQNAASSEEDDQQLDEAIGDDGPGLATSGDVASMIGGDIDDLNLPSADDVAGWRQDGGTIGQDSADKEVVDTGQDDSVAATSGEFVTGRADKEGGWGQYPNSGDLGQVDPGQQNYSEDQDSRQAFTAGDYKTSQEEDPEEGSDKYHRRKIDPEKLGESPEHDQERE